MFNLAQPRAAGRRPEQCAASGVWRARVASRSAPRPAPARLPLFIWILAQPHEAARRPAQRAASGVRWARVASRRLPSFLSFFILEQPRVSGPSARAVRRPPRSTGLPHLAACATSGTCQASFLHVQSGAASRRRASPRAVRRFRRVAGPRSLAQRAAFGACRASSLSFGCSLAQPRVASRSAPLPMFGGPARLHALSRFWRKPFFGPLYFFWRSLAQPGVGLRSAPLPAFGGSAQPRAAGRRPAQRAAPGVRRLCAASRLRTLPAPAGLPLFAFVFWRSLA